MKNTKLTKLIRWAAVKFIPEGLRFRYKRWRKHDVVRDGRWLARRSNVHFGNMELIKDAIDETNLKPWTVLPVDTYCREQEENLLLTRYPFSFHFILVIINPYGKTPLCAQLLFHTDEKCRVQYVVKGRADNCDFTYTTEKAKQNHTVPVFGLYANSVNTLDLALLDADGQQLDRRDLKIQTGALPKRFLQMVTPVCVSENTAMPFIFVTGGISGPTYVFDQNGDIRYYLSRTPRQYGVYPMPCGRFLFPERNVNRPTYINSHANILYDMDYLGRVRETYYVPDGTHHCAVSRSEAQERQFLAASSSLKKRMEDVVLEYDRNTGDVIRKLDLGNIFPKEFQNRFDWAHMNQIVCCDQNQILVSLRNLHTVAKIDLRKEKLVWILSHPDLYKGTAVADKVLRPIGKNFHYFFQQHAAELVITKEPENIENGWLEVMLFDNHCAAKRKAAWFDNVQQSYVCFYRIDECQMTVQTLKCFVCDLSPTRSNAWFDREKRRVFAMAGAACAVSEDSKSVICEWDYDTQKLLTRYKVHEGFFKAFPFKIRDRLLEEPIVAASGYRKGAFEPPVLCSNIPSHLVNPERKLEAPIKFAYMDDLILVHAQDHKIEKVFLKNLQKEFTWVRDFTDTYQKSEVFARHFYYVAVPIDCLPSGTYGIILQYEGKIYDTKKWFHRNA